MIVEMKYCSSSTHYFAIKLVLYLVTRLIYYFYYLIPLLYNFTYHLSLNIISVESELILWLVVLIVVFYYVDRISFSAPYRVLKIVVPNPVVTKQSSYRQQQINSSPKQKHNHVNIHSK